MTIPDPPWKRKTRPCPFYSQGRCLFSDSCSFLHDVKIKVQNPEITIISSPTPESTPALSRSDSITSSPASPGTVLNKVRSPPRSPRLSSLLLALGSAIPPEEEADDGSSPAEASTSRAAELVPPDAVLGQVSPRRSAVRELDNEAAQAEREVVSLNSPEVDKHTTPPPDQSPTSRNRHSQPSSEKSAQEHEGTDIMSPVELTTGPPFWNPIGNLPQSYHREDSVDSGYADTWTGPQQFALSPPRRNSLKRYSTLSLLSSPFGSPARAISPKFAPVSLSSWPPGSPRSGPSNSESASEPPDISECDAEDASAQSSDELDSPTKHEADRKRRSDASHFSDADPEKTVKQSRPSSLLVPGVDDHVETIPARPALSAGSPADSLERHVAASPEAPQTVHPLEPSPFLLSYDEETSPPPALGSQLGDEHRSAAPSPTLTSRTQSPRSEPSPRSSPQSAAARPTSTLFDYGSSPAATLPSTSPLSRRSPGRDSMSPRVAQPLTAIGSRSASVMSAQERSSPQTVNAAPADAVNNAVGSLVATVDAPLANPFSPSSSPRSEADVSYEDLYAAHINPPMQASAENQEVDEDVRGRSSPNFGSPGAAHDFSEPTSPEVSEEQTMSFASLYAAQSSPAVFALEDDQLPRSEDERPRSVASVARTISPALSSRQRLGSPRAAAQPRSEEPSPVAGPSRLASPAVQAVTAEDQADSTFSYASFYDEAPLADPSRHSTPRSTLSRSASLRSMSSTPRSERTMLSRSASVRLASSPRSERTLSRSSSVRSSVRRTPTALPSGRSSPAPSVSSVASGSLLRPPGRESTLLSPHNSPSGYASPRIAVVDNNHIDPMQDMFSDFTYGLPSPSPYSLNSSPVAASPSLGSPAISRQSSVSDLHSDSGDHESRRSSKVPFGFRNSLMARKRDSLNTPRPGSAPLVRPRPPALVGIGSNRSNSMNDNRQDLVSPAESASSAGKLRPLRLSVLLNSPNSALSFNSGISPSPLSSGVFPPQTAETTPATSSSPPSPSVQSEHSLSNSQDSPSHCIPSNASPSHIPADSSSTLDGSDRMLSRSRSPSNATSTASRNRASSPSTSYASHRLSHIIRSSSRLSEPIRPIPEDEEYDDDDDADPRSELTVRVDRDPPMASAPPYARPSSVASFHESVHAIATPRPTLLFAIASDNVDEVRRVLESGEAGPNDDVGPQSALAFALTAANLAHRKDIVKLLLAHGANPASLRVQPEHSARSSVSSFAQAADVDGINPDLLENLDPATRYYIARADAPQTRRASSLIHRSFFRPLTRVRFDLIGQDRALEQLFRVLSMPTMAPIVVLLCGPSGHGKSLLARRFGSLLEVPTHTVNMTTLRSTRDIWKSYSMSPYEEPSDLTLAEFLKENEGQRCVVVLDEIEKTENEVILSSLLMPWELGRVSFEASQRHVDCSKVIWLGTSNIGHDLVFEHQATRHSPEEQMAREEYVDLMKLLRPKVSERLGPSLLSRVTTVLPFVPFTTDEKMAIAAEALFTLSEDAARSLPAATVEKLVKDSLQSYVPAEGARSLYRAVSTQLLDTL